MYKILYEIKGNDIYIYESIFYLNAYLARGFSQVFLISPLRASIIDHQT